MATGAGEPLRSAPAVPSPSRRALASWVSGALIGRVVSFGRDVGLAALLGLSAQYDAYLLVTTIPLAAAAAAQQVLTFYAMSSSRSSRHVRVRSAGLVTALLLICTGALPLADDILRLPPTGQAHVAYMLAVAVVPVAGVCAHLGAALHLEGRGGYYLSVPFASAGTVLVAAALRPRVDVLVAALLTGWIIDALVLALQRRRLPSASSAFAHQPQSSLVSITTLQVLTLVSMVLERSAAGRISVGLVATAYLANRLVMGCLGVPLAALTPYLLRCGRAGVAFQLRELPFYRLAVLLVGASTVLGLLGLPLAPDLLIFGVAGHLLAAPSYVYQSLAAAWFTGRGEAWRAARISAVNLGVNLVMLPLAVTLESERLLLVAAPVSATFGALVFHAAVRHSTTSTACE